MKFILYSSLLLSLSTFCMAENSFVSSGYQNFQFKNSVQKDRGERYITHLGYKDAHSFYEFAYSKTYTKTFQPPMKADLNVDKYYFKYSYLIDKHQSLNINYTTLNDNLTKETDGGNIYGLSYRYKNIGLSQYFSDYKHFDTYQTDIKYKIKQKFDNDFIFSIGLKGSYIFLENKDSNKYTTKADTDYFNSAVKLKIDYNRYYTAVETYMGKRIFAIMNNGFSVQSRAMEFDRTYNITFGKKFEHINIMLKYLYMRATEIPADNKNVEVNNFIIGIKYSF